jgi:RNA polymerase-binding protein DksA
MRRRLGARRESIFRVVAGASGDLRFIAEDRESEPEERAQEEVAAHLLARLDERGRRAIEEIDSALARIAAGAYGVCVGCGRRIGFARLQAMPAATLCADCAREAEVERHSRARPAEMTPHHPGSVPADLALLSDGELEGAVVEALREDGRVEMEELRVVCRHGIVHVEGALPSEREHEILRAVILDILGVEELVDHVRIDERLFERRPRVDSSTAREEIEDEPLPAGPMPERE